MNHIPAYHGPFAFCSRATLLSHYQLPYYQVRTFNPAYIRVLNLLLNVQTNINQFLSCLLNAHTSWYVAGYQCMGHFWFHFDSTQLDSRLYSTLLYSTHNNSVSIITRIQKQEGNNNNSTTTTTTTTTRTTITTTILSSVLFTATRQQQQQQQQQLYNNNN